jgi:hypothetical protein
MPNSSWVALANPENKTHASKPGSTGLFFGPFFLNDVKFNPTAGCINMWINWLDTQSYPHVFLKRSAQQAMIELKLMFFIR